MRRIASALLLSALALGLQPATAANSQQDKVKTCSESAADKQLAGESRKLYMKGCLAGRHEKTTAQQQRMKTCTADVGTKRLKGDARRSFMKQCLSADSDTTA